MMFEKISIHCRFPSGKQIQKSWNPTAFSRFYVQICIGHVFSEIMKHDT
jgi:hypothetical protein